MERITSDDIAKLGRLARIGISEDMATALTPQLAQVIDYVAKLQEVDTSRVEMTDQVTALTDVWREDDVIPSQCSREELLQNAPETQDGYIKVRRILT